MAFVEIFDFAIGPLAATFLLGLTALVLIYWYSTRTHDYWKDKQVPYIRPLPIFGSIFNNFGKPLHEADARRYNEYGAVYGHFEGSRPLLSVGDPVLLRDILVKDFHVFTGRRAMVTGDEIIDNMMAMLHGEAWKRIRSIISPTFSTGRIKKVMNIFKDCSKTLIQNFKKFAEEGTPVNTKSIYGAFTMDVLASSFFSMKIDSHNDPNNEFVAVSQKVYTSNNMMWRFLLMILCPAVMKLFKMSIFPGNALEFYSNATLQVIEERKKTGQTRNDFLQLLIDSEKESSDESKLEMEKESEDIAANYGKDSSEHVFKNTHSKSLTFTELVSQCVGFFLAGFDTSSATLSFATYLLALNEDVQDKLREEVDETLEKSDDGELTYEAIQSMKYLDNVISETLRMYPPLIRTERIANQDYKLGDTGLTITKGMIVTIPIYAIQRDPQYYPEPEKFDPDRFTPEERAKRNQYAYLPFGLGPRNCVAMRFALVEVKICLAYVISNFKIKRCAETKVPLEFPPAQAFLLGRKIKVKLEMRKGSVKAR